MPVLRQGRARIQRGFEIIAITSSEQGTCAMLSTDRSPLDEAVDGTVAKQIFGRPIE
jgi:hypothetical protein